VSDHQWHNELTPVLRTMQIVVGALVAGCAMFLVVVLVVAPTMAADRRQDMPLITYVATGFAVVSLIVRAVVPGIVVTLGRRRILNGNWPMPASRGGSQPINVEFIERTGDAGRLAVLSLNRTIIAAAMLEGAAFFALVAYMIERLPLALVVAVALIVGVALHFPTRSRLVHWVEDQLALIEQERQRGR